jgi:hypothetical protein
MARDDVEAVQVEILELDPLPDTVVEHRELNAQIPQAADRRATLRRRSRPDGLATWLPSTLI